MRATVLVALPALPATDVPGAVDLAESGFAAFTRVDCTPATLRPACRTAFDAWMSVSFPTLGSAEDQGLKLAIAF